MHKYLLLSLSLLFLAACSPQRGVLPELPQPSEAQNPLADAPTPTPLPNETLTDLVEMNSELSTLLSALQNTGFDEVFETDGPFTLLAPSNAAFNKLDAAQRDKLLQNPQALSEVLKLHTLPGSYSSQDLAEFETTGTLKPGVAHTISNNDQGLTIDQAQITTANLPAKNGTVHIIDTVFITE